MTDASAYIILSGDYIWEFIKWIYPWICLSLVFGGFYLGVYTSIDMATHKKLEEIKNEIRELQYRIDRIKR
jgi:hypothetical protein